MKNLIDRVRLAFRKDRQFYSSLYKILGFYPHKIEYYHIALAHSSKGYRTKQGQRLNNERLEYLGDAVLETVVSDILFHKYPNQREGFLSSTRSKLVQRSMLGRLAKDMGIERLITAKGHQNAHNSYLGGNAFEALVGAVYLDRGFDYCQKFVRQRILDSIVNVDDVAQRETNFKSRLLEWCQKNKLTCEFKLVAQSNETRNTPLFTTSVEIENIEVEHGTGYSRKESEQTAARNALILLRADTDTEDKIYAVVEARTAMEAPRICAVPRIPELEQAVQKLRAELRRKNTRTELKTSNSAEAREIAPRNRRNTADTQKTADTDTTQSGSDEQNSEILKSSDTDKVTAQTADTIHPDETSETYIDNVSDSGDEAGGATNKRRRRGGRKHKKNISETETTDNDTDGTDASPIQGNPTENATDIHSVNNSEDFAQKEIIASGTNETQSDTSNNVTIEEKTIVPASTPRRRKAKKSLTTDNSITDTTDQPDNQKNLADIVDSLSENNGSTSKESRPADDKTAVTETPSVSVTPESMDSAAEADVQPPKRKRGRPRKTVPASESAESVAGDASTTPAGPATTDTPANISVPEATTDETPDENTSEPKPRRKSRRRSTARKAPAPPADMPPQQ